MKKLTKLLTALCTGDAYAHQSTHTHSQPLFLRLCMILFLSLVGMGSAWAQAKVGSFNPNVRYSQWVMDSRLGDFKGNTKLMGFNTYSYDGSNFTSKSTAQWKESNGTTDRRTVIDYVAGLVAKATIENAIYYGSYDWSKSYFKSVEDYANTVSVTVPTETANSSLDNLNAAKMYFGIKRGATGAFSGIVGGSTTTYANTQLGNTLDALKYHNTNCIIRSGTVLGNAGKTVEGGWWHKGTYNNQMWCDGQYMGPALLAELVRCGSYIDNATDDWNTITKQFTISWNILRDPSTGLLYHAFDANAGTDSKSNSQVWANSTTGLSQEFWGRAVGWYFLALVDVLDQMKSAGISSSDPNYVTLSGYLSQLATALKSKQDASGCWYQLLNHDDSFYADTYNNGQGSGSGKNQFTKTYNYLESSCTAIFTAAYYKAIRLGLLDSGTYRSVADKAYNGLVTEFMHYQADNSKTDGSVTLLGCCKSAGLGQTSKATADNSNYRDGSAAYYLLGSDVTPTSTVSADYYTEGKVLGGFIMAATEYEMTQDAANKTLFAYDLKPAYSCNGTSDALTVKVDGKNANSATYQWFKDGVSLGSTAQTASYIPTESGSYLCKATTSEGIIQTSSATVTVAAAPAPGSETVISFLKNDQSTKYAVYPESSATVTLSGNTTPLSSSYGGTNFSYGLKLEQSTSLTINPTFDCTATFCMSAAAGTLKVDGTKKTASDSKISVDMTAGTTYTITKADTYNLYYVVLTPKGGSTPTTYAINCGSPANGTVTSSVANAAEGASVTLTIAPSAGYKLSSISATDASSNNVALSGSGTTRTFTMPASDVTVSASFVAMETSTATTVSGTTGGGTTLTATPLASDATGQQTMTITKATGASYEIVAGSTTAANVSLDGTSLKYDAPAAGESKVITLRVTPEYGAAVDYTINVSTAAAAPTPTPGGDVTVYSWNGNGSTTTANEKGGTASKIGSSSNITVGKSQGGNYTWTIATTSSASGDAVNVAFNEALEASDVITIGYFQKDEGSTYLNVNFYNSRNEEIGMYSSTNADYIASNGTPSDQTLSLTTGTYEGATYARIFRTKDGSNSAKTIYISKFVITRQGTPEPGFTVTFDGNGQTVATTALTQPTTGQAILLPAGYDSSENVAAGSWNGTEQGNTEFVPEATGYYEVFNGGGSVAAGNVLTQTISGLDNASTYEIVLNVGASATNTRDGLSCSVGNNLTVAFADSKSVNIPVFDRTQVTNETKNTVTFVLQPTDGSITFGLRNIAPSGNWFIAKVESIKKVNTANFNGWYTAATDGTKVGDAGDEYAPTGDITLYAQWKGVPTHLVKFNPAGGTATVMAGSTNITAEATNGTGAQVEEGTQVVITVTAPVGKGFKNWKNNLTGATTSNTYFDGTSYKYTVASLTEDVDLNVKFENKVEYDAPADPAILFQTNVTSSDVLTLAKSSSSTTTDLRNYATVVGAAATLHNGNSKDDAQIVVSRQVNLGASSGSYMMIDLGEGNAFAAGDIITFGNNEQLKLSNTTSAGSIKTTSGVYTVQESDVIANSRYLYIFKDGDSGGSYAFSSLLITRGALKKDITRLSPKGSTAKNTMYVSETNTPNIFIGPFEAGDAVLSVSDFEITCEPEGVVTAEIRDGSLSNTIDANGYRTFTLNINTVTVGSARVNINFLGNDQYKAKSDYIPYNIIAKRTVTFNANEGIDAPAAAYCGDGQTITVPEAGSMTKTNAEFVEWNTAADGSGTSYAPGDVIPVNADLTLYAQWKQEGEQVLYHYTVTASQSAVTDDPAIGGTFSSTKAAQADGSIKVDFNSQSSKNIKFSLNKAIAAGDVIKITMHQGGSSSAGENTYGFGVSSTTGGTPSAQLWIPAGSNQNVQVLTYTVTAENNRDLIGQSTLYLHRLNGTSLYFHEIEITRVAAGGTDATIKSVVINGHIIPETVDSEGNPTYIYNIGELYWGSNTTIPVTITPNDAAAKVNSENAGAATINVEKDVVNNVVITAANGSTTATYKVQVNKAQTLGETTDAKYAVSNTTYYEGQNMRADGVTVSISTTAGSDDQLSFPVHGVTNPVDDDYKYRIINSAGASAMYNTTTGEPTSGAYYQIVPTKSGMLTVAIQVNSGKPLIVSNGAKIFVPGVDYQYSLKSMDDGSAVALDNSGKPSVNAIGTITFSVSPKTYYLYAGGSKLALMGFELNTTVPKYTVTANTTTGGSVSINGGAITSGSKVDAGTPLTIVATPATDYKFTGWTNADGEVISTQSTYTVDALNAELNITAQFAATGIVTGHATFPLDVMKGFGNSAGDAFTNYDTGNAATANVTLSTSSNNVQGQNSSDGTKVRPNGTFTITPATGRTIKSIVIHSNSKSSGRVLTSDPADDPTADGYNYTYTFNADGSVTFTNSNASGNVYVTAIDVVYEYHAGDEKSQYLGSFPANSSINDYVGAEYEMPKLTVTNEGAVITEGFTVTYSSKDESIAMVEEGTNKITLVGAGSTSIVATITPTVGNANILGSTATIAVTSKALEALEVTIADLTINNTDADYEIPVPVVKVGDKVLAATEYTVSYTEIDDTKNIVTANGAQLSINGSERNWTAGTASVKITVTPTAAAKEKYHCVASATANFNITVVSAQSKRQPVIDMLDEITVNTGVDQAITFGVLYDGNNLNDIFGFEYVVTPGTATGATLKSSNKNVATVTTGSVAGTATITVTATPKKITNSDDEVEVDYADIYESATKTVTINIAALRKFQSVTVTPSAVSFATGKSEALTLTVKDENGDVLDEDEYTAIWSSNNPGVASVNAKGIVTGVTEGNATLTVVVITDGYEGKNVTVGVQVTDPSMYKAVTGKDKYTTGTVLATSNKNIEVTLGGWTFPATVKAGTTQETFGISSDEFNPSANLWQQGNTTGLKLTGFSCYADGVAKMKNPRNENGSNSQPEATVINDKYIQVFNPEMKTIDPMFNVPCAGSYLVFAPKTNGTITAYIYQNGAFESNADGDVSTFAYAPQRRVFIIDEAGNFVPSSARLQTTSGFKMPVYKTGSNKGKPCTDLTKYNWLMKKDGSGAYTANGLPLGSDNDEIIPIVKSHFVGLNSFDPENVVNGVYEPTTELDEVLNNNINDKSQPGARGWVVLVPAPVIYTFNVQAGKTYHLYNFGSKIGLYGFKFIEDEVTVDEVELSEVDAAPKKTQSGHVAKVNMSDRVFKNGVWNAGVLPFSLNKQQVDAIFGHTYDKDHATGTQIMYFDRVENDKIIFVRHSYNTIVAGKPFIIKPAKGSDVTINTANVTNFPYVTIEEEGTPADWGRNNGSGFIWRSSYQTVVGGITKGDYYLNTSGDVSRRASSSAVNIKGFRGWLHAQGPAAQAKVLGVGFDSLFDDDDQATDIELVMDEDGNILERPTTGVIYNINGVAVSNDASKLYSLPQGLYIVNGKKYNVK